MRVLITGGRNFYDKSLLKQTLDNLHAAKSISVIIHGGCSGADRLAGYWAKSIGCVPVEEYKYELGGNGRSAGPRRNAIMLREGKPDLVVAFPGGKGTADMVKKAKTAGVKVVTIEGDCNGHQT